MVDGILLLVDASEGPLPQTRFVLKKALEAGLTAMVCINKIDRSDARAAEVLDEVYDLFIDLDANDEQLDFPILYTNARTGTATRKLEVPGTNLSPLFDAIVEHLPGPEVDPDATLQLQVNNLDYDDYVGRLAIGRMLAGSINVGQNCSLCRLDGSRITVKIAHLYAWQGLKRVEAQTARAGDIVIVAGLEDVEIGETIADLENPRPLAPIRIDEPTVAMTFSVNNSPWAGREGDYVTSRKLGERLDLESRRNVSIRVEQLSPDAWRVMGRGELQLAVIVETMRREGYELQVSKPTVLTRQSGGQLLEPMEFLMVDIPEDHIGVVTQMLSVRKGKMRTMVTHASGRVRLEYDVPARGLIGFRGQFLESTRGSGVMNSLFNGYAPWAGPILSRANGAMISDREGVGDCLRDFPSAGARTLFYLARPAGLRGHDPRRVLARDQSSGQRVPRKEAHEHPRQRARRSRADLAGPADDARSRARMDRRGRARRGDAQVGPHAQSRAQNRAAQQASRRFLRIGR